MDQLYSLKCSAAWLGAVFLAGCSPPDTLEDTRILFDLVSERDSAEVRLRTDRIDLGTPEARNHLGEGWSWNEIGPAGESFVWMLARSSELLFFSIDSEAHTLRILCRPLRQKERSVVAVTLSLDDLEIGRLDLERGWKVYELPIPPDALRPGLTSIDLEPVWSPSPPPGQVDRGQRRVAVAVDWIEFRYPGAARQREQVATLDPRSTALAAGSRFDYYLMAPEESYLVIDSVRFLSSPPGHAADPQPDEIEPGRSARLDIWAQDDENRATLLASATGNSSGLQSRLPSAEGPLRLRLEARGATFELESPRVVTPTRAADASPRAQRSASSPPTDALPGRKRPRLVVLYLIDTLRADQLGFLGHDRATSRALDRFAEQAVVFENAIAQSSWTKSSVASLLTGHLPWKHGAERLRDALIPDLDLLPQLLQAAGFHTGAFVANGMVGAPFGFDRGWDRFSMLPETEATAADVHREALQWIDSQPADRPIFIYLHTVEPHTPYDPSDRFLARFDTSDGNATSEPSTSVARPSDRIDRIDRRIGSVEAMRRLAGERSPPSDRLVTDLLTLYNGEIAAADFELDRFLSALRQRELLETALFSLVSDHGEEFYDHGGWTHGRTLHRESVDVPFVLKFPGSWAAGTRVQTRVQHIDLLPTLLDYLQIEPPSDLPGASLLCAIRIASHRAGEALEIGAGGDARSAAPVAGRTDALEDCPAIGPRPIFTGVHYYGNHWLSIVAHDWKLIVERLDGLEPKARLYDLATDPAEMIDLAPSHPILTGYLTSLIRREVRRNAHRGEPIAIDLDEDTRQRLEALGYLQ